MGWFVLGEDQQQLGPYAFSELRGEFSNDSINFYFHFDIYHFNGTRVGSALIYFDFVVRFLTQFYSQYSANVAIALFQTLNSFVFTLEIPQF